MKVKNFISIAKQLINDWNILSCYEFESAFYTDYNINDAQIVSEAQHDDKGITDVYMVEDGFVGITCLPDSLEVNEYEATLSIKYQIKVIS